MRRQSGGGLYPDEVRIEVLYFDGCPNHELLLPHLRALLASSGIQADVVLTRIDDADAAERHRFLGSPTVRINGVDVEPDANCRTDFGLKCRLFDTPSGLRGLPTDEWILAAATESNVERARRGFAAALNGDLDAVREFLDPNVTWHGGDPSGACRSREQVLEFMTHALHRGRVGELIDVVNGGDKVVVIMQLRSQDGEPGALSANLTTFWNGKAVEMVHYPNPQDALTAAGI